MYPGLFRLHKTRQIRILVYQQTDGWAEWPEYGQGLK